MKILRTYTFFITYVFLGALFLTGCNTDNSAIAKTTTELEQNSNVNGSESDSEGESDSDSDSENESALVDEVDKVDNSDEKHNYTIVWLGDSLTQGSLGDDNDNLDNAPYVKLSQITGNPVEGFGFYGYNASEVFWVFSDEDHYNQKIDSDKVYIFWVGSNDWAQEGNVNTDTDGVMERIDYYLAKGIDKYLILGAIQRHELCDEIEGRKLFDIIDEKMEEHYGEHFMRVADIVHAEDGFGPDHVHFTQESYDKVAYAVAEKLAHMDYL